MTVRVNKSSFNIREKLSELGRKFGLKGSELVAAETVQEARDLVSAGRRNILYQWINVLIREERKLCGNIKWILFDRFTQFL